MTFILADKLVSTNNSIVDWKNFRRDMCVNILISDNRQIVGKVENWGGSSS